MGTKRKPIRKNDSISYEDLDQYGLGSWIKENGMNALQTVGGVNMALAGAITANPALIAGGVGMAGNGINGIQQTKQQNAAKEVAFKDAAQNRAKTRAQNQLQQLQGGQPDQTYMPVAKCGGRLKRYAVGGNLEIPIKTNPTPAIPTPTSMDSSTRTDGYSILDSPEKFVKRPEPFLLDPSDVVSKMEGQYWRSTSGYTPKGMEPYYHIARGKDKFLLTPKEYEIAKGYQNKPQYAMGGTLNYGGQLHEGPNGGNPVDGKGNVNLNNPTALVQKGEVGYNTEDGSTYIFSDDLYLDKKRTFANEAKRIQSKYSRRLGKNMIEKHDALASKGYNMDMKDLLGKQEQLREAKGIMDNVREMKKGGKLPTYGEPNQSNGFDMTLNPMDPANLKYTPILNAEETLVNPTPYNSNYTAAELGTGPDLTPTPYTTNQNLVSKDMFKMQGWKPDTGMDWQSAASLIAPVVGTVINRATRKRPRKIKLDESGVTPVGINLERERAADREQANLARANIKRALKSGTSAQGYMANVAAAETGVQRGLGQQLGESYQKEEVFNANLPQGGPSEQAKLQAAMYNSMLDAQTAAQKQGDVASIVNALNMYGRDVIQSKRDMNYLQMMDPRYRVMARRRKWYSPKEQQVQINPNIAG